MSMEQILITGVGGFIGSKVAKRFIQEGYEVIGVDDLSSGCIDNIPEGVKFIKGDLSVKSTIRSIPSKCQRILHLAGQSSGEISFDDPVADLQKNTISTLNLIKFGIANSVERFVYASSMSVYGEVQDRAINEDNVCVPLSCYGVGKYASEVYLRVYKKSLPSVSLRMFNVYGPGQDMSNLRQGMVSIYLAQALTSRNIEVKGSTERFRDFIFIDDVVEAWYRATTYNSALGQIINVGTGVRTSVSSLLDKICAIVPHSKYYVQGSTPGDQSGIFADNQKIESCLGMSSFTKLDEGLEKHIEWTNIAKPLCTKLL